MKKGIKGLSIFPVILILLLAMTGISAADFEGTVGTRFTITDSGFSTRKPRVYVEYEKKPGMIKNMYAQVEKWSDTSITSLWTGKLSAGTYKLWVKPGTKGSVPVSEGTFNIMNPVIDEVTPSTLTAGETITINGQFFTNKKPEIYLKDSVSMKRNRCNVLSSITDPETGASSLNFVLPEWDSGNYNVVLQTRIGQTSLVLVHSISPYPSPTPSPSGGLDNWHLRTSGTTDLLYGVIHGNGTFVAVSITGTILTSTDGVTWSRRNSGTTNALTGVTYGNGTFVAVGDTGTIVTSTDGITWTKRDSGATGTLYGITYGDNIFTAVGEDLGRSLRSGLDTSYQLVLTSTDGIIWPERLSASLRMSALPGWLYGINYGNGTFVAVGVRGALMDSTDGISWADCSTTFSDFSGVAYGNGIFVVVGGEVPSSGGVILTSTDGCAWTQRDSGLIGWLDGVTYGDGTFVAVGYRSDVDSATILTSTDGVTWTQKNSGTTNSLVGVTYGDGTFLAVGDHGVIVQSDPVN